MLGASLIGFVRVGKPIFPPFEGVLKVIWVLEGENAQMLLVFVLFLWEKPKCLPFKRLSMMIWVFEGEKCSFLLACASGVLGESLLLGGHWGRSRRG